MSPPIAPFALTVVHRPRDAAGNGLPADETTRLAERGFFAGTCMRELAVLPSADALRGLRLGRGHDILHNTQAYAFLLQTVTGLNSSVPGETNVQGQLRKSWQQWRNNADGRLVRLLSPAMHRLFNDARVVRRNYLQGIGGNSYGSLVRKLIQPQDDARILVVGAGDLARSLLPFFTSVNTAIWNRHQPDAHFAGDAMIFAPDEMESAAAWATELIMTTPPDNDTDAAWAKLAATHELPVVHLGRRRAAPAEWANLVAFRNLDDVFDLRRSQSTLRSLNIMRARTACERIALSGPAPPTVSSRLGTR